MDAEREFTIRTPETQAKWAAGEPALQSKNT